MPSPSNLANDDMTLPELAAAFPPVFVAGPPDDDRSFTVCDEPVTLDAEQSAVLRKLLATPVTVPDDDGDDDDADSTPIFTPRNAADER